MSNNFFSKLTMILVLLFVLSNTIHAKRTQQSLQPKSILDEQIDFLKEIIHSHSRLDVKIKALLGLEKLEDVDTFDGINGESDLALNAENYDDQVQDEPQDLSLLEYDPDHDHSNIDIGDDGDDYGFLVQKDDAGTTATETDLDVDIRSTYFADGDHYDFTEDVDVDYYQAGGDRILAQAETDFDILYDIDDFSDHTQIDLSPDDKDYDITDDVSVDYMQPSSQRQAQKQATVELDDTDDVVLLADEDDSYDGYDPLVLNDVHSYNHGDFSYDYADE